MFSPFGCSFPRSAGCLIGCFAYSAPVVVNCVQPGLQVVVVVVVVVVASGVFAVPVKSPLGDFGDFGGGGGGGADNVQLNHIPKKAFRSGKPKSSPKP